MKKLLTAAVLAMSIPMAQASFIESDAFLDYYGYYMSIDSADNQLWNFSLTNTSTEYDTLIDGFALNLDNDSFTVSAFDPASWTFTEATGGVQFDYVGERGLPGDRLVMDQSLTFDFIFSEPVDETVWTETRESSGQGLGGGEDSGQIAVSFQQLGADGEGSDLLASNWTTDGEDPPPPSVTEPGIAFLFGLGLIGLAVSRINKTQRDMKGMRKV